MCIFFVFVCVMYESSAAQKIEIFIAYRFVNSGVPPTGLPRLFP